MNKFYAGIIGACCSTLAANAQTAADYAVQLTASTQISPPQIKLTWKKLAGATGYTILRKGRTEASWSALGAAPATDSMYTDGTVIADSAYEYKIVKSGIVAATGYMYGAVSAPAIHHRGGMILLVDSVFRDSCRADIQTLMSDMRGDGWSIVRHDIGRGASVASVRSLIQADYAARPGTKGLLLLGHIPVPYSGDIAPDGHIPDHLGAWPADAYYADVDGPWTDNTINNSGASRPQNRNVPGDGKLDQTYLPSEAELQVGRIDFANMPAITRSEVQLMRAYLTKAHRYKTGLLQVIRKGLVDDNFGAFGGEAFAANAWRTLPGMIGQNNIFAGDYLPGLKDSAYLWSYGCGAGSHSGAGGIGTTANFDTAVIKGIFSMMFGSYFGDWDVQNNFLRAPLCAPDPVLTNCWAGRPNWFFHHMALGENIGYSALVSQNNNIALYEPTNYGAAWVHVALMGDPTLRTDYIRQPAGLGIVAATNGGAKLTWTASPDAAVAGYYVYRADSAWGDYKKVSGLVSSTTFTDLTGANGKKYYLVRPVKLQQTPSGGYYNLGIGIVDSANVTYPLRVTGNIIQPEISIYPNPASDRINATINSVRRTEAGVTITDALGRAALIETVHLEHGENDFSWSIALWPAGWYTIALHTNDGSVVRKWVKAGSNR